MSKATLGSMIVPNGIDIPLNLMSLLEVSFGAWQFEVAKEGTRWFLRVVDPLGVCNVTGGPLPWNGRWWRLSRHMTDGEVVQTALKAVLTALEHEAREKFTYRGVSVFDSHLDIEKLVELRRGVGGGLKERDHHV